MLLPLVRRHGGDLVVIVIAVMAQVEVWTSPEISATGTGARLALSLGALGWTAPLFFRRRFTLVAPLLVLADFASSRPSTAKSPAP